MRKIEARFAVGLVAVCITTASFVGCAGEASLDPPADPAKVQELRGDQATGPETAADPPVDPTTDATPE